MIKKSVVVFSICLLLIGFASAGWWSDFWGGITGNVVGDSCNDACSGETPVCWKGNCYECTGNNLSYCLSIGKTSCLGGTCMDSCTENEIKCVSDGSIAALKKCVNNIWTHYQTCSSGICNDAETACGVVSSSSSLSSSSSSSSSSSGGAVAAVISQMICTPNENDCRTGTNIVKTCTSDGMSWTYAACPAETLCDDGECFACERGSKYKDGKCVPFCENTDSTAGDLNAQIKTPGMVYYDITVEKDSCVQSISVDNKIKEWYCDGSQKKFSVETCPKGYKCQESDNGAYCVQIIGCSDSDAMQGTKDPLNGRGNKYLLGQITYNGILRENMKDSCSVDKTKVLEWYCEGNEPKSENLECGEGYRCYHGICKPHCVDSDGGARDYENPGIITVANEIEKDECLSEDVLIEKYCDGSIGKTNQHTCSLGFKCEENAEGVASCVSKCEGPTKDELNISVRGIVYYEGQKDFDRCWGPLLYQKYCPEDGGEPKTDTTVNWATLFGKKCEDGIIRDR